MFLFHLRICTLQRMVTVDSLTEGLPHLCQMGGTALHNDGTCQMFHWIRPRVKASSDSSPIIIPASIVSMASHASVFLSHLEQHQQQHVTCIANRVLSMIVKPSRGSWNHPVIESMPPPLPIILYLTHLTVDLCCCCSCAVCSA